MILPLATTTAPHLIYLSRRSRIPAPETQKATGRPTRGLRGLHRHGLVPARGTRCRFTSRMLRARAAAPAESDPVATPAAPSSRRARCGVYGLATGWSSARAPAALRTLGRRSEHEGVHRDEVVEHGLARRAGVASRDRLEAAAVVRMRAGGPAGCVEGFLSALGEQVHDRVRDPRDRAIAGG